MICGISNSTAWFDEDGYDITDVDCLSHENGWMLRAKQTDEDEVVVILKLEMLSQSLESFLLSEVAFSIPIGVRFGTLFMWASGDSEAVHFLSHGPRKSFAISNDTLVSGLFLVDYCPLWPRTADLGQSWIVTRRGRLGDIDCLELVSEWRRSSTVILYSFALASAASEPKDTWGSRGRGMGIHSLLSTSFLSPIGKGLHSALRILGYQLSSLWRVQRVSLLHTDFLWCPSWDQALSCLQCLLIDERLCPVSLSYFPLWRQSLPESRQTLTASLLTRPIVSINKERKLCFGWLFHSDR